MMLDNKMQESSEDFQNPENWPKEANESIKNVNAKLIRFSELLQDSTKGMKREALSGVGVSRKKVLFKQFRKEIDQLDVINDMVSQFLPIDDEELPEELFVKKTKPQRKAPKPIKREVKQEKVEQPLNILDKLKAYHKHGSIVEDLGVETISKKQLSKRAKAVRCIPCGVDLQGLNKVQAHLYQKHNTHVYYECHICHHRLNSCLNLVDHFLKEHLEKDINQEFKCPYSKLIFKNKTQLQPPTNQTTYFSHLM